MDTRKKLFKTRQEVATITKRIQSNRLKAGNERKDRFAMNRNLVFSPLTPAVQRTQKISEISNKKEKLLAWRTEKNRVKFKETIEKRSPFQTVVPVGRFISPKVKTKSKISTTSFLNKTPIRNMLKNEKVLKKSTIKDVIKTATIKKNVAKQETAVISRKRILDDISVTPSKDNIQNQTDISYNNLVPMENHFEDSTFKIKISENISQKKSEKEVEMTKTATKLRRSKSFLEVPTILVSSPVASVRIENCSSDPVKKVTKHITGNKAVVRKPIVKEPLKVINRNKMEPASVFKAARVPVKKIVSKAVIKKLEKSNVPINNVVPTVIKQSVKTQVNVVSEVKPREVPKVRAYQLYKTSLDNQRKYITSTLDKFSANEDEFIEDLTEDNQLTISQTLNQGKKLLSDKFKAFEDFLEKAEADYLNIEDSKRITEEDVENYWSLLYAEIKKLNVSMLEINEIKNETIQGKVRNEKLTVKVRQSRSNFANVNCTPRRSMRVAVAKGTPKHSTLCLACTPVSASKANTPKSRKKRSVLKSVIFVDKHNDSFPGTPKRRNSSRRYKATPKASLAQLGSEIEDDDDVFG
ncbi:unnamed protein product [Diamesa tonsa]